MTGKQRAFLRSLANGLEAKYQIGKGGIDEETANMIDSALEANELIKIKVLENAFISAKEACEAICDMMGDVAPVQCIGNKFVLYRESKKNKQIKLPK